MTISPLLSYGKRVCVRVGAWSATRWAAPALAAVAAASICASDLAHAQRVSAGSFQPPPQPGGMRGGFGGIGPGIGTGIGLGAGLGIVSGAAIAMPSGGGDVVVPTKRNVRVGPPDARPPGPDRPAHRSSGVPPDAERRYVPDEVMVELAGDPADQTFAGIGTRHRLNRLDTQRIGLTNSIWVRWRIPDRRSVPAVIRALEADTAVRSAQPNYLFALQQQSPAASRDGGHAEAQPTEPAGDSAQYALAKLHLPEAQAFAQGKRVVVAIIDTEIDKAHAELSGAVTDSYDALGIAAPMEAHGTGIAGTIAAHARLLGAAPAVSILAVRAFGGGSGTTMTIIKGLDYAVAHDARIINMSFAGPVDPALTRALATAHGKGRILIAAVGNKGPKSPALFPAADPNVIAVTAVDAKDKLFDGANRGDHVAIAAPGVDILVPAPGNVYTMSTGTSFAAAFVSGVAALLAERKPDLTPDAAKKVLMSTAHDLGPKGRDSQFGAGLMDASRAILAVDGRAAGVAGAD
jgi:subtilisin family serine protease